MTVNSDSESAYPGIIINESPGPRLLIHGLSNWEDSFEEIKNLVPTARHCESLAEVRQAEWDVIVTDQPLAILIPNKVRIVDTHLCVIFVPKRDVAGRPPIELRADWRSGIQVYEHYVSQELVRIHGLPERIATLTHEQLEPILKIRERHQYFGISPFLTYSTAASNAQLEPFIMTGDGKMLAGRYKRSLTSEAWLLPSDISDIIPWIRAALAEWHSLAPDRFPSLPDWSETPEWMTAEEKKLTARLTDISRKREELLAKLEEEEGEVRRELLAAQESASVYERALLTSQSEDLVKAVMRAFTEIGFAVTDADLEATPDDHLEDLRVEDEKAPGWVALVEVKGYTKGAKTEALTQFLRFNIRYQQRAGKVADGSWYIVNQFLARDPSTRQPALHGKDDDISAFASAGGLVIDTVTLFKILQQIQNGLLDSGEARTILRSSTGRLDISSFGKSN